MRFYKVKGEKLWHPVMLSHTHYFETNYEFEDYIDVRQPDKIVRPKTDKPYGEIKQSELIEYMERVKKRYENMVKYLDNKIETIKRY